MHIFILNIIAVLFLSVSVVVPVVILGTGLSVEILRTVWPAGLVTVLALCGMNGYFLKNRRLFSLLKREDWPALADYLEKKVYKDGKYSSRNIRLLAHSYLVLGDFDGALRLENNTARTKPALVDEFALVFGAARILGGNSDAAGFFKEKAEKGKAGKDGEWLRWYYGFSLILARSFDQARTAFADLAAGAKDPIVTGLSAYFLSEILGNQAANAGEKEQCLTPAEGGAGRVREGIKSLTQWKAKASKLETQVHGVIIRKYIADAGEWLFKEHSV